MLRDAEHHPLVKEVGQLRFGVPMGLYTQELGAGLEGGQRAMLRVAMTFFTWRTLARDAGLSQDAAVDTMVRAILCVGRGHDGRARGGGGGFFFFFFFFFFF